jgi:hypothetical protein
VHVPVTQQVPGCSGVRRHVAVPAATGRGLTPTSCQWIISQGSTESRHLVQTMREGYPTACVSAWPRFVQTRPFSVGGGFYGHAKFRKDLHGASRHGRLLTPSSFRKGFPSLLHPKTVFAAIFRANVRVHAGFHAVPLSPEGSGHSAVVWRIRSLGFTIMQSCTLVTWLSHRIGKISRVRISSDAWHAVQPLWALAVDLASALCTRTYMGARASTSTNSVS